jgi:hypothetical protein
MRSSYHYEGNIDQAAKPIIKVVVSWQTATVSFSRTGTISKRQGDETEKYVLSLNNFVLLPSLKRS